MKYTYSDEDDEIYSDSTTARRSARNTGTHTPAEALGPTITQSGRQVKSRHGGAYGVSMLSGTTPGLTVGGFLGGFDGASDEPSHDESTAGRPRRAAATNGQPSKAKPGRHIEGYNDVDEMTSDEEGDASEQDYGDDEEEEENVPLESDVDDQDELSDEDEEMDDGEPKKLIVKLAVKTPTPERKTTIKLRFSPSRSPERESSKALFPATMNGTQVPTSDAPQSSSVAPTAEVKENIQPESSPNNGSISANPYGAPPKPQTQPPSPLAIRGSPEKPAFTTSIDVGN